MLRILKQTDWQKAPLYQQFRKYGRWTHHDESIYSEIELKYLCSSLEHMVNQPNYEEFNQTEGQAIIQKHWGKTVHTLEILMNQMNMMYFFHKLRLQFEVYEQPGKRPSLMALEKIMNRCFKLYNMIDDFMKIYKLIELKEKMMAARLNSDIEPSDKEERKYQVLIKRLSVAIVLIIKENPVLPVSFKFAGGCLLERLKAEREEFKAKRAANDPNYRSPLR